MTTARILGNNGLLLNSSQEYKEQVANELFRLVSVGRAPILSRTLTTPPISGLTADSFYIVPAGASGAWAGKTNQIAFPSIGVNGQPVSGAWLFYEPFAGLKVSLVSGSDLFYNGSAWTTFSAGDMNRSVYDTDEDGIVDEAESIAGNPNDNTFYGKESGNKGFFAFFDKVRATVLTGLTTGTNTAITATDSLLTALQKLQAQINSTITDLQSNYARLAIVNNFTTQQRFPLATLTDGATINWNLNTQQVATVTLAGNRTLAAPTNIQAGGTYILIVRQDGTGNRTLTLNSAYKFSLTPVLSTAANAVDIFSFVSDGTNLFGSVSKGYL
jgi:hypothetical protein